MSDIETVRETLAEPAVAAFERIEQVVKAASAVFDPGSGFGTAQRQYDAMNALRAAVEALDA